MSSLMRIFIVGQPGAGKTLLAKRVAERLGWEFIDADFGLEFQIGLTLKEILGGTEYKAFNKCQSEIIKVLTKRKNIVVTTDTSIVCDEKNRKFLSDEFVVFLDVSTPIQIERLSKDPAPLLAISDLAQYLEQLHTERDPHFAQIATITLNSDEQALDKHVGIIANKINENAQPTLTQLDAKDLKQFNRMTHRVVDLTQQQALCLKLLAQGKSAKEIARAADISYRTVEEHIATTMQLLGCSSSKELIALYHGLH